MVESTKQGTQRAAAPSATTTVEPTKTTPKLLPPYKVILHNDDKNEMGHVIQTIVVLTTLNQKDAELRTMEAHESGQSLLLVTHKERAELYVDQFKSASLTVTIEPDE